MPSPMHRLVMGEENHESYQVKGRRESIRINKLCQVDAEAQPQVNKGQKSILKIPNRDQLREVVFIHRYLNWIGCLTY